MKIESPWGVVGIVTFALICCLAPILVLALGAGALAALMGYRHYALARFPVIVGVLIFYIFVRPMFRPKYKTFSQVILYTVMNYL